MINTASMCPHINSGIVSEDSSFLNAKHFQTFVILIFLLSFMLLLYMYIIYPTKQISEFSFEICFIGWGLKEIYYLFLLLKGLRYWKPVEDHWTEYHR